MGLGRSQQPLTLGHPVTPRLRRARDGEKGIALASCVERTLPHTALVTAGDDQGMDTGTHARANARAHTHMVIRAQEGHTEPGPGQEAVPA